MVHDNDRSKVTGSKPRGGRAGMLAVLLALAGISAFAAEKNAADAKSGWLTQPMSLHDAIRTALAQNGDILKSQHDLEAAHGVAIQTRAILLPKLRGASDYQHTEAVETDPGSATQTFRPPKDQWSGSIRLVQSLYEGGRMVSAFRSARLVTEQAFQEYQTVIANTLLTTRTAYYNVLLAEQEITVRDAAVKLLAQELENTKRRFDAGAVPRFDVLRGEVEVANARPKLIRARNTYRTAKNNLANVLGYNIPSGVLEDLPINLTTKLDPEPFDIALPSALAQAKERRSELSALRTEVDLQRERVVAAKSGYKPSLGVFASYGGHNSQFRDEFYRDVTGPTAGVEMRWDIFDGLATQGKVVEARARQSKASVSLDEMVRRVEQEVRTAYSSFIEAREVLESQKKVAEKAEEAIRLASARYDAGSSTQLDLLNAQTSLTEARTTQNEAARDYLVARARLERAMGLDVAQEQTSAPTRVEIWKPKP